MHFRFVALLLIPALCSAQVPTQAPQPAQSTAPSQTLAVPSGTLIPLTLVSSIRSKTTKPGDSVRAMVAFPITVSNTVAIPAGTYVEGVINSIHSSNGNAQRADVKIHFTRLLFANGYSAPLDAVNTDAFLLKPAMFPQRLGELADARDGAPLSAQGLFATTPPTPTLPPLPHNGPNPAIFIGASVGAAALTLVLALTLNHRRMASTDFVLFESGWQFQMTLNQPLALDAAEIAAAANAAPAH